jgi:hemerythrin-like domain-containing protein
MLIQIGRGAAQSGPVEHLLACHTRIRHFLSLATKLAETRGLADSEVSEAALLITRYFTQALPLHARDEDESVLPRLKSKDSELDAALEVMHREHAVHDSYARRLIAICSELVAEPNRHAELTLPLQHAVAALAPHMLAHIAREEETIFPAMRKYLDQSSREQISKEIRDRHAGIDNVPMQPLSPSNL